MKGPQQCTDCGRTYYRGAWMWLYTLPQQFVMVKLDGTVQRSVRTVQKLTCMRCG